MRRVAIAWWVLGFVLLCSLGGCGSSATSSQTISDASTGTSGGTPSQAVPAAQVHARAVRRPRPLGPLATLERYWREIGARNYAGAYAFLGSGSVPQTKVQFVSEEELAQIESVHFAGTLVSSSGSSATVAVDSLTTTDGKFGCRTWSGSYGLIRQAGRWRIERASITPAPCPSSAPPSSTDTGTSTGIGTGTSSATEVEGPGSTSHATDAAFCTTHICIPNFPNGNGAIVQCADGEWSHSGGLPGACSYHGGEG